MSLQVTVTKWKCVCQVENPLKIHKRKGPFDEFADTDVVKSAKKDPKVREVNRAAQSCM